MHAVAAFITVSLGSTGAYAACVDPDTFKSLRYDEDYSYLAGSSCRHEPLDAIKYIPLRRGEGHLTLGGELRVRGEYSSFPDLGLDITEDRAALSRLLVHADAHLTPSVRVFVQLGSYFATGRKEGDGPTDEDRLDLAQGFVDLSLATLGGNATLRFGRQEVTFGSARLVSVRESPNIRRAFDGGRAFWRAGRTRIDAFYLRPVDLRQGVFDDPSDDTQEFYGVHATVPLVSDLDADLYYFGFGRERARFAGKTAFEDRHTVGLRLFGKRDGFDWDLEAAYQFGSFGALNIRAWTIATDIGHTFSTLPWKPRLGLKADVASGDRRRGDGTLGTFNALFPQRPYFTEAGLVAPANIMDVHPTLDVTPAAGVALGFGVDVLWRHRREDAFYIPPLAPVLGVIGGDRYVGWQAEFNVEWRLSRHLQLKAWYVRFEAGNTIKTIGGHGTDFVAGSLAWKF